MPFKGQLSRDFPGCWRDCDAMTEALLQRAWNEKGADRNEKCDH
jgi:hypothetical protein